MNIFETIQNTVPIMPKFNNPMFVILFAISFFYLGYSPVSATMNLLTLNCIESVDYKVRQWTKVNYQKLFDIISKYILINEKSKELYLRQTKLICWTYS